VWSNLEAAGVVEPGVVGYIPNFQGADQAAERLAALPIWQQAHILKIVPDRVQLPILPHPCIPRGGSRPWQRGGSYNCAWP
jgi:5-formyltetrahydrofolate cyclo-ligase